jgi:hypothetical protein
MAAAAPVEYETLATPLRRQGVRVGGAASVRARPSRQGGAAARAARRAGQWARDGGGAALAAGGPGARPARTPRCNLLCATGRRRWRRRSRSGCRWRTPPPRHGCLRPRARPAGAGGAVRRARGGGGAGRRAAGPPRRSRRPARRTLLTGAMATAVCRSARWPGPAAATPFSLFDLLLRWHLSRPATAWGAARRLAERCAAAAAAPGCPAAAAPRGAMPARALRRDCGEPLDSSGPCRATAAPPRCSRTCVIGLDAPVGRRDR